MIKSLQTDIRIVDLIMGLSSTLWTLMLGALTVSLFAALGHVFHQIRRLHRVVRGVARLVTSLNPPVRRASR